MTIKAIVIERKGDARIKEVEVPKLRDDYILVRNKAIAINPTDWKHIHFMPSEGARVGCDYAGVVEEVGPGVTKALKKGQRVTGMVHGANALHHDSGTFAEVITAKGDIQAILPDNVSFEDAATFGVGISTVGQALYQSLKLPLPGKTTTSQGPLLIYGGSTATGTLAIQYAKLSGLEVVVTCSEHNFDLVKKLGADKAFDYKSPTCAEDIKKYTKDNLKHVFDPISEGDSIKISVGAMSSSGGIYSTLSPVPEEEVKGINDKVELKTTLAYSQLGETFIISGNEFPAKPEDYEFGKMWWSLLEEYLPAGKIKPHPSLVNEGGKGLEGALKGLDLLKEGKVSGKKLVYTLD